MDCPHCKEPMYLTLTAYDNDGKHSYEVWKCRDCGYRKVIHFDDKAALNPSQKPPDSK